MSDAPYVMLVDFDGTAARDDVQQAILDEFADHEAWRAINKEWASGHITTAVRAQRQWALLRSTPEQLRAFVDSLPLDPCFLDFVRLCDDQGYPVYIVSDGFDFYIEPMLRRAGLEHLPVIANSLRYDGDRPQMRFLHQRSADQYYGNDKTYVLEQLRRPQSRMVFIGDGYSDREVARHADVLFAKDRLAAYCVESGVPYLAYDTFCQIIDYFAGES